MNEAKYISHIIFDGEFKSKSYLDGLPVIKYLKKHKKLEFNSNITFFVGENGAGKFTLLEAIAVAYGFNAEGGSRNFNFSTNDTHSELCEHIILGKRNFAKDGYFLRAESLYNVATNIEELDKIVASAPSISASYGGASLHHQSHGESFLSIVKNRFGGNGLYILDEPEAALSPKSLLSLMIEIKRLLDNNSQFIIATHSPILMTFPDAEILSLSNSGINKTDYRETEHYNITKHFLENPEKMLDFLFGEKE